MNKIILQMQLNLVNYNCSVKVGKKYVCKCADMMLSMGYSRKEIEESLFQQKYNDIMATYLLLARRGSDVSCISAVVMPTKLLTLLCQ